MLHFVRFDNHFPLSPTKPGFNDEATVRYVGPEARGALEHFAQLDLREAPIFHPLLDVRRELQLPIPPLRESHSATLLGSGTRVHHASAV